MKASEVADEDFAIVQAVKVEGHRNHSASLESMLLRTLSMIEDLTCPVCA
ncbi:hypothetical protein EPYR_02757 [Erwinia pyrifoliae DSM 12163]|nr:hypothetical protein EPYR_02757 [Erwinia pyrifoliae DSM 12163]